MPSNTISAADTSPADTVFALPELCSLVAAQLFAICTPVEFSLAGGLCAGLRAALKPHWHAVCLHHVPGVVHMRSHFRDQFPGAEPCWQRLYFQVVRAMAEEAKLESTIDSVLFSAEVRLKGKLVFVCTFDSKAVVVGDFLTLNRPIVDKNTALQPLTVGEVIGEDELMLTIYAVDTARGGVTASVCTIVTPEETDEEDHPEQLCVRFTAPVPNKHGESRLTFVVELFLTPLDLVEPRGKAAVDSSSGGWVMDFGLLRWLDSLPPADSAEGQRARARRMVVNSEPEDRIATLEFLDENGYCDRGDLRSALDALNWVA